MRIAIVKLSSIGDIAHTAFIPQALAKYYPHITIDWFCDANFVDILEQNHYIANVYPVVSKKPHKQIKNFIGQFGKLKQIGLQNRYNVVIDLQGTFKSALIARTIATTKQLWGFKETRDILAPMLYTKHLKSPLTENVYIRAINAINQALGQNIIRNDITIPFLYTYSDAALHSDGKSVLIFPSSSVERKNYSVQNWVSLIKSLPEYKITLLYGNEAERQICESIAQLSGIDVTIIGNKKLGEVKELLLEYQCVIGGDTGILHIASALGVKNIILYGPTPQYRTNIHQNHSKSLQGNGDVNKIPYEEIVKTLQLLVGK